jgi:dTDP-4-amino-4,6-dideoxygalactose transaminase
MIDPDKFGLNRDAVAYCLEKENIATKKYYYPPVHKQDACRSVCGEIEEELPVTDFLSQNILSLPIYSHMSEKEAVEVCKAVQKIYNNREKITKSLKIDSYEEVKI